MADTPNKAPAAHAVDIAKFLQEVVNKVAKAGEPDKGSMETEIDYDGTKIILPAEPERMELRKAIETLVAKEAAGLQKYSLHERLPGMPFDAAAAFVRVLRKRYGWVHAQTMQTWFGPQPPQMQVVKTGHRPEDYIEVPIGQFKLDDISVPIETGFARPLPDAKRQFMDFYISGEVSYDDRKVVMDIIAEARREMAENSIYKGKPLRLRVSDDGNLQPLIQPEFIDLEKVDTRALVLKDDIQALLDMTLNTPIERTADCRRLKIPLKRGILLYGPYGTGKSLTGTVTARRAIDSGWTFVMVDNASALSRTLEFARQFQPCVVFAEDIDRAVSLDRDDDTNDIVNTIDSVLNKSDEVITVLTTNDIDALPPVILRPGRLDALVPIELPDAKAALRLVHLYAGDQLEADIALTGVGESLSGFMPSTIREVVERAKLAMLMRQKSSISAGDITAAAVGLKAHAALLSRRQPVETPAEALARGLKQLLLTDANGAGVLDEIQERVAKIERHVS